MLRAMIQLAPRATATAGDELPAAVRKLRTQAEFPKVGECAYVIARGPSGALVATAIEVDGATRYAYPFMKMGPRAAQAAPVFKRGKDTEGEVSPKQSTLEFTLKSFLRVAHEGSPAARVYRTAIEVLGAVPEVASDWDAFAAVAAAELYGVISTIPYKSGPGIYVSLGTLPEAHAGIADHLLGLLNKRATSAGQAGEGECPLCGRRAPLAAMGLAAAKINFLNKDNHNAFPDFDEARADARFAICADCGSALRACYVNLKAELRVTIAGASALVLPYVHARGPAPDSASSAWDVLVKVREGRGTDFAERDLLFYLADESSLTSFHILWAETGDELKKVTGFVTDIPGTRLGTLSSANTLANAWAGGVLPTRRVRPFDLRLSLVGEVFEHPGGDRVKRRNGMRLAALRKRIARAVYLGARLDPAPLMTELRDIIADHLVDPTVEDKWLARDLTNERPPDKKGVVPLNAASRIRHMALLFHYLRHLEVLPPMASNERYVPRSERLQKLLAPPNGSGVDTDAKMFAFLVGLLFGRLLTVQGAKGVNVRSNAITWLRRATLTGSDLPGLYVRVREKFAEYESERSPALREVVFDTSALGVRLGTSIPLDADITMYFLFLGQALAGEVFARDDDDKPKEPR